MEVDLDPISFLTEHLHPEVERPKFFPVSVAPQYIIAIESPISRSQPPEIYFGPDEEILPPGLILIEEIPQDETPLTPTHFQGGYLPVRVFSSITILYFSLSYSYSNSHRFKRVYIWSKNHA